MEEANEDACIAELFGCKGKKKNNKTKKTAETVGVEAAEDSAIVVAANDGGDASTSSGVRISLFDFSVENFFQDMDTIAKLCREEQHYAAFEQSEIQRISSSVTFLREWRDFKYPSRSIRFAYGLGSPESSEGKNDSAINLPQFSSATVPKHNMRWEDQLGDANSRESRDFVMNAGGPVWALDWCPRVHEKPDCSIECKFIAVAAHPPGSSYHKMGASLTGRGVIQIWCLLNIRGPDEEVSSLTEERKKRPNKDRGTKDKSTQIKRPRGRPRKNLTLVAVDDTNCETQYVPALAVQVAENSTEFTAPDGNLEKNEEIFPTTNKRKGRPKKNEALNEKSSLIKRPRGRPKKNSNEVTAGYPECENQSVQALVQVPEDSAEFICPDVAHGNCNGKRPRRRPKKNSDELTSADPKCENQSGQALAVQVPEDSAEFLSPDRTPGNCNEYALQQYSVTKGKHAKKAASACNTIPKRLVKRSRLKINSREGKHNQDISQPLLIQGENEAQNHKHCNSELGPQAAACSIPGDVTLPRVVSCLAHNGKVAWDVKWRPTNISDSLCKHRMGYLAVLLGNGSLEVWEVPLPHVLRAIYMHKEGTDPRFIKLEPVFKCSSIPLTVEWSVTPSHDYLLAGCHDGTVALWKFSANASSKCDDTKPVLCFGGDTVPIRTVAWAPFEGDPESSNIIVTAGHEGLKFWDLRYAGLCIVYLSSPVDSRLRGRVSNPFRHLRSLHPAPRIIYSLDWLSNPSCIIMSFEDGTVRTINLAKAANDLPVSGTTYNGKKQPGMHSSSYSSSAIWSVQVSRITGMVAYCCADGTAFRFQLTTKGLDTDGSRNRVPFFLCGSLTEEESTLVVNTPVSNSPFPLRKSYERSRHAESFRELLSKSKISKSSNNNKMAKASDSQTLALCDGNNLGLESGSEEALSSVGPPKRPKLSGSSKKKPAESTALVCGDDVSTSTPAVDNEKSDVESIPEAFPPKIVAFHRVRWNMNKGSERWLCFGGASGLLRCQEIVFSDIDKKWALKR